MTRATCAAESAAKQSVSEDKLCFRLSRGSTRRARQAALLVRVRVVLASWAVSAQRAKARLNERAGPAAMGATRQKDKQNGTHP